MVKKYIVIAIVSVCCGLLFGFVLGVKGTDNIEQTLREQFTDDVIPVRQGKLAGWVINNTDNASLIEEWEELCSDVIREFSE